ncbi:MAG: hypothetical protein CMI26_07285 [Opitutae bacterium]|nr:hypothetical protein [Opitutae bacterium]
MLALPAGAEKKEIRKRFEFTRMLAHWANYSEPGYLAFIDATKPDLVQLGFYGAHFWSLAHTPQYKGYPAHFPLKGLNECGKWFEQRNGELTKRKVRVIGHLNVEFLVGDPDGPEGPRGFFKFYRDLWNEKELGPKPVKDPLDFLERDKDDNPLEKNSYRIGGMKEYFACLRNPHWQIVLKAWVKRGIERGVDGFVANYFYRHDCHCKHCVSGFKQYLLNRFAKQELKDRLGIANLDAHRFDELVCWHKPQETTQLRLEMLRWSQISNKKVFDEVFIRHGRRIKPDLLVAQWNHLGNFSQISGDERCLLPADLWGKDEDYVWYSTGNASTYTDLPNGILGDATLQARYIRGAFGDKPFTIGKYEGVRTRVAIAELAANGGSPMGFYARFSDPAAREVFVRYYQFLERHDNLFRANSPYAEMLLLFPRKAIWQGNLEPLESFRKLGRKLLDQHVLFDVLPDDLATPERLAKYQATINPAKESLPSRKRLSRFVAPVTLRICANRPANGNEIDLHFVNYDRDELPKRANGKSNHGRGPTDERPIAVSGTEVSFVLSEGVKVTEVEVISPEYEKPLLPNFRFADGRISFTMPQFLVYAVARLKP